MKFTLAAACLLGVTLAKRKYALADDRGYDNNNVTTADLQDDQHFWQSYYDEFLHGEVELSIRSWDLYDETIFKGSKGVVFNVDVVEQWPDQLEYYRVKLSVYCADGFVHRYFDQGSADEELKNIQLEADTTACGIIENVKVTMERFGWPDRYWDDSPVWKNVDLYVWNDRDHFWTNEDGYKVEPELCFDMVSIFSEETIEFIANSSTPANDEKADQLVAGIELYRLTKDGKLIEQVAESISAEAVGEAKDNIQSTLVYKQKVEEDTFYQLCFFWDQPDDEENVIKAKAGSYQYGYRIQY